MTNIMVDGYSTWMTQLDGLQDKTLREITLPGTHHSDSMTLMPVFSPCSGGGSGFLGGFETGLAAGLGGLVAKRLAVCQNTSATEQLALGVRYFDLRNCFDSDPTGQTFYTHHTVMGAQSADALQQIADYMRLNQSQKELVIIEVNYTSTTFGGDENDALIALVRQYLAPYLFKRPDSTTRLADIRLRDIVSNGSRVVALYNSGSFEDSHILPKFESYRDMWSFKTEVVDLYGGNTNVGELSEYMQSNLPANQNAPQLIKLQWILEWKGGQNPFTTLEHYERDLPGGLQQFMETYWKSRINVIFTDFYEKEYQYVMPLVLAMNSATGENALDQYLAGQMVAGTDGLDVWQIYMLTSLSTPGGSVYNLTVDDNGEITTRPADSENPRQRWQIVFNTPAGGYALFNAATMKYLAAPGANQPLLAYPNCGIDDTGFSIVGGNGSWVIRRQTNDGDNVEARGEAGDGAVVETWSWNGGPNQNWSFAPVEDGVAIPNTPGLKLGSRYVILSVASNDGCAIELELDNSLKLRAADESNPAQQWQLVSNVPGTGIAFLNLATGKQWSAANSEVALSGVTYKANAGTSDSGFQIGAIGENCWIRRTDNEHLHVDDYGGDGQAGDTVGLYGWHGDGLGEFMWKFQEI
jgi:hypothetical protein